MHSHSSLLPTLSKFISQYVSTPRLPHTLEPRQEPPQEMIHSRPHPLEIWRTARRLFVEEMTFLDTAPGPAAHCGHCKKKLDLSDGRFFCCISCSEVLCYSCCIVDHRCRPLHILKVSGLSHSFLKYVANNTRRNGRASFGTPPPFAKLGWCTSLGTAGAFVLVQIPLCGSCTSSTPPGCRPSSTSSALAVPLRHPRSKFWRRAGFKRLHSRRSARRGHCGLNSKN